MLGTAAEAKTGIHPGSPYYDGSVNGYDVDLDKANQILHEAGYAKGDDGMRFGLNIDYGWAEIKQFAEYMKPQLNKIGHAPKSIWGGSSPMDRMFLIQ